MRDDKAFASLTSGLLARKGQARPAMRAQGYGFTNGKLDDLGWNDMGHDAPTAPLVDLAGPTDHLAAASFGRAGASPARRQREKIAEALARREIAPAEIAPAGEPAVASAPEPVVAPPLVAAPVAKARPAQAPVAVPAEARKAAFTLRITAERHLRLRLACAVQNRSAQQIVTAALDGFLATLPDVERLATSLSAPRDGQD